MGPERAGAERVAAGAARVSLGFVKRGIGRSGGSNQVLIIAVALLAGCAGPLAEGESQFSLGQYPDAKQTLLALEAESRTWNDAKRAEYALYRGLTHAALGDGEKAAMWLGQAREIERVHPGSLSARDARRLRVAAENGFQDGPENGR
jgi:hypothetical protein